LASHETHMSEYQKPLVILPRFLPRDFLDVCLGLPIGLLQAAIFFGLTAVLTYILTHSEPISLVVFLTAYGFSLLFVVRRLTVSATGLQFHRILGSPKFLPWERISSVALASRRELIIRGWLWPPFPPRECSACLSATQHYRIMWNSGFCYYPPAEPQLFEQFVVAKIEQQNANKVLQATAAPPGS